MHSNQHLIARDLSLFRGDKCVIHNINLDLAPGSTCLLRGANGAGKSSLLACLAGMTTPDVGKIPSRPAFHWLGHKNGVKLRETPRQHIQTWGRAFGASFKTERDTLTDWGLSTFCDLPAKFLSQGQKRRTALARLGLEDRPLWLLDEPFSGLDADGQAFLLHKISSHTDNGGLVVIALHGDIDLIPTRELIL